MLRFRIQSFSIDSKRLTSGISVNSSCPQSAFADFHFRSQLNFLSFVVNKHRICPVCPVTGITIASVRNSKKEILNAFDFRFDLRGMIVRLWGNQFAGKKAFLGSIAWEGSTLFLPFVFGLGLVRISLLPWELPV